MCQFCISDGLLEVLHQRVILLAVQVVIQTAGRLKRECDGGGANVRHERSWGLKRVQPRLGGERNDRRMDSQPANRPCIDSKVYADSYFSLEL
jgi:hypothetical protein